MEQIDPIRAQQVWSRVRSSEPETPDSLRRLLALEAEIRHICHYLQKNTSLRDSRLLLRLREDSQRLLSTLSGLCMITGIDCAPPAPPSVRGSAEGLLRQCYKTRLSSISLLASLPAECAPRSPLLKRRMEDHAMILLELLGSLPRR